MGAKRNFKGPASPQPERDPSRPLGTRSNPVYQPTYAPGPSTNLQEQAFKRVLGGRSTPFSGKLSTDFSKDEENVKRQFALMKQQAGARFGEAGRKLDDSLSRFAARSGRTGGEAIGKARETGAATIGREQASIEAGIGAQESAALQGVSERKQQAEQVKATLAFQEDSFAQTMSLEWAGMDLNERITLLNSVTALSQAGIDSKQDWQDLLQGPLEAIFPQSRFLNVGLG
jgi:hypothetical protein